MNITSSPGSVGAFSYFGDDFGISQGFILSTGKAESAVGPITHVQVVTMQQPVILY